MNSSKVNVVTTEGLEKLKKELEYKETTEKMRVAEQLKYAIAQGDLSENAEYDAAKNDQAALEQRITELKALIENAVVVDETSTDEVSFGSVVTIIEQGDPDAEEEVYTIVGSIESNPMENKISNESPIGMALMGAHEGDVVEAHTPSGPLFFKILKIAAE
ncbi:MAG: transcription elongation factor GreA [Clostridia bacterium]|nr:transcription elongation factor GreA [Clostridia bacterium]